MVETSQINTKRGVKDKVKRESKSRKMSSEISFQQHILYKSKTEKSKT